MQGCKFLLFGFLCVVIASHDSQAQKITSEIGKIRFPWVNQTGSLKDLKNRKRIHLTANVGRTVIVEYISKRLPRVKFVDDRRSSDIQILFEPAKRPKLSGFAFVTVSSPKSKESYRLSIYDFGNHDWLTIALKLAEEFVIAYRRADEMKEID